MNFLSIVSTSEWSLYPDALRPANLREDIEIYRNRHDLCVALTLFTDDGDDDDDAQCGTFLFYRLPGAFQIHSYFFPCCVRDSRFNLQMIAENLTFARGDDDNRRRFFAFLCDWDAKHKLTPPSGLMSFRIRELRDCSPSSPIDLTRDDPTPVSTSTSDVAAAVVVAAANAPPVSRKRERGDEAPECMICMDRAPNTLVLPCMDCVVCDTCSDRLANSADAKRCVACRRKIARVIVDSKPDRIVDPNVH